MYFSFLIDEAIVSYCSLCFLLLLISHLFDNNIHTTYTLKIGVLFCRIYIKRKCVKNDKLYIKTHPF